MKNDTKEDERKIPGKLFKFIKEPVYINFLECLLAYCKMLFSLENKQDQLAEEARSKGLTAPGILNSEKRKLQERASKMANAYSWIILKNQAISQRQMETSSSFIQFKSNIMANEKADKNFYDTLIIFSSQVL